MIRSKAIALKCLECSGGISKEITLCHLFDCPLWQFRFGHSLFVNKGGKIHINEVFRTRMESIKERWPEEFEEIKKIYHEYYKKLADKRLAAFVGEIFGEKSSGPISNHSLYKDPF